MVNDAGMQCSFRYSLNWSGCSSISAACCCERTRCKEVEILLLRRQLAILQRTQALPPRLTRWEKLTLAMLANRLTRLCGGARVRLDACLLLFRPDTVLRWHRDLVRRKWTFRPPPLGRPPTSPEVVELILRLAQENPRWGYSRIHGELTKLGYRVGRSTVQDNLKRRHVPPAPERERRAASGASSSRATATRSSPATSSLSNRTTEASQVLSAAARLRQLPLSGALLLSSRWTARLLSASDQDG
jgi:Homeodomain-like domain